jgi:hypothetical protein
MKTRNFAVLAVLFLSFGFAPSLVAVPTLVPSSVSVPVAGVVFGLPESVFFTGTAQISVRPADADAPGAIRRVVVSIDLGELSGVGLSSRTAYVAGGLVNLTRALKPGDVLQTTIPFTTRGGDVSTARTALATFALKFDMASGMLTAATAFVTASTL